MRTQLAKWTAGCIAIAAAAVGCYGGGAPSGSQQQGATSCNGQAASCPPTQPSYATDVSPIVFEYCAGCHAAGKSQSGLPLDSYGDLANAASKVQSKVSDCSMPPSNAAQPSAEDRDAILQWIACGAPND
ncbi:MAG TPA: hypothetical protein VGH28_26275 [Polyangiaceae bacterium]|jgi:uncharacterized membrane protein